MKQREPVLRFTSRLETLFWDWVAEAYFDSGLDDAHHHQVTRFLWDVRERLVTLTDIAANADDENPADRMQMRQAIDRFLGKRNATRDVTVHIHEPNTSSWRKLDYSTFVTSQLDRDILILVSDGFKSATATRICRTYAMKKEGAA